jgi:hypothetical protein
VALFVPSPAGAWGERTHEIINRRSIEFLPEPARSEWAAMALPLGAHASDADHRKSRVPGERARHFIDIDVYDEHPFDDVPRDLDELVRKRGREEVDQWGTVPWAIEECYRMLVLSLERGDWSSAGAWGADLGHYVADSHQPLHCTVNYDGQNTGNDGVHLRFEVHMMNRHFDETLIDRTAPLPDPGGDVVEFCFGWIAAAYPGLHPILRADTEAREADSGHSDAYYQEMWSQTRDLATSQVTAAARDLAALYLAAWEEAGSPPGPAIAPPFSALPPEVLDPPQTRSGTAHRGAWLTAAAILVSALVLGSR